MRALNGKPTDERRRSEALDYRPRQITAIVSDSSAFTGVWEQLGRTIATYGFLEDVLGKAIFAFTATRNYSPDEIDAAYQAWLPQLERALTDQLWNLAESYGKAARDNPATTT